MNTGAQSRLLNIGRCMQIGQRQLEQTFTWSRSNFFSSNVFRQQGGRNSLEPGKAEYSGITSLRPQRENDASKFLGAHSFSSSIQNKRPYCGKQEGRRWIMKHHFKGMPTLQVINIITLPPFKKPWNFIANKPLQDFDLVSEPLPELKEGEILIKWL